MDTSHIRHAFSGLSAGTSNCVPQAVQMRRSSLATIAGGNKYSSFRCVDASKFKFINVGRMAETTRGPGDQHAISYASSETTFINGATSVVALG